ncbi:MAG: PD40 domain-containing protein, partial [Actinobacteria bacterium]|nr:PD40 domain-containing protein [Actinomycetota bacterium]
QEGMPAWSPDGRRIAMDVTSGSWPNFFVELFTVSSSGGAPRRLTTAPYPFYEDSTPTWSPDGRWIVFQRLDHADLRLVAIRRDGTVEIDLGVEGYQPAWEPARSA